MTEEAIDVNQLAVLAKAYHGTLKGDRIHRRMLIEIVSDAFRELKFLGFVIDLLVILKAVRIRRHLAKRTERHLKRKVK